MQSKVRDWKCVRHGKYVASANSVVGCHIIPISCLIPVMFHSWEEHFKSQEAIKGWIISQQHSVQNGKHLSIISERQREGKESLFLIISDFLSHAGVLCLFFDSLNEGMCLMNLIQNNYNLHIHSSFHSLWVESRWENRCLYCYDIHKEIPFAHWSALIIKVARDVESYWAQCGTNNLLFSHSSLCMSCAQKPHFFYYIFLFLPCI